jgi:DNA-directed RNA polymerase subunit L
MEINILKDDKNELKVEISSLTIAEILRVYLNEDPSVSFVAWKREHPSKKPSLHIKTSGKTARKALADAISSIEKDTDKVLEEFKTSKTK